MGNLIQRNRGKKGAPDVTRNLSTGKVTTTYRDPRKKGSLGLRVTKSHDNKGNVHVTESFNYGGGVTKKTRTKQNKSFSFSSTTSGKTRRRGKSANLSADESLVLIALGGILAGIFLLGMAVIWAVNMAIQYWYITVPCLIGAAYFFWRGRNEEC